MDFRATAHEAEIFWDLPEDATKEYSYSVIADGEPAGEHSEPRGRGRESGGVCRKSIKPTFIALILDLFILMQELKLKKILLRK